MNHPVMHSNEVLQGIYQEHCHNTLCMAETLAGLDVARKDVELLFLLPWQFLANRIAVERERLDLTTVHPLPYFKPSPPPPAWLTPATCKKIFELALEYQPDEAEAELEEGDGLVLPA